LSFAVIVYSLVCVFLAAIVRGYSGFGFSLLVITALSLALTPAQIVPSIFLLEIAASLHLLPAIWRDIHWRSLLPLIVGCLIATPFGVRPRDGSGTAHAGCPSSIRDRDNLPPVARLRT
jgi:uncharacterized membrane protein YfcA